MLPPVIFCANAGVTIVTGATTAAAMPKATTTATAIKILKVTLQLRAPDLKKQKLSFFW